MATIIEAIDVVAKQLWNKDWQDPAWKECVLTGDAKFPGPIFGNTFSSDLAELKACIARTVAKLKGLPADWLNLPQRPAAKLKDGSPLSTEWLLYMLYRQSRVKEMRGDIEARPVIALLDRQTTGDLALAAAQDFFASKADPDDRWAMAFAALIGNDCLAPIYVRQIKEWADSMRGKLAEYARPPGTR